MREDNPRQTGGVSPVNLVRQLSAGLVDPMMERGDAAKHVAEDLE